MVYTTILYSDGWECNCPGAFNNEMGECVGMPREAAQGAVHHVRYYGTTWPHIIVRKENQNVL